jgi:hypothetical protein
MILGYYLIIHDNDHYMFKDMTLPTCAKYSNVYEINMINPKFRFGKKLNVSYTYDGFVIVSEAFKQFCENFQYNGVEFVVLPNSPGFYWFKIHNVIEFDTDARKTRFMKYNAECNGFEEIIGMTPICLKKKEILGDGFFRSGISFGSCASKSPAEMVGEDTMKNLKKEKFKGLFFEKILDKYDWQKDGIDPNEITISP